MKGVKFTRARALRVLAWVGPVVLVLLGMLALITLAIDAGQVTGPPVGG